MRFGDDMNVGKGLSKGGWGPLRSWYRTNGRHDLPWRIESTPWKILLAETMLRRTRAHQVAHCSDQLYRRFDTPEEVVCSEEEWLLHSRYLGLTWRAKLFWRTCKELVDSHGGNIPRDGHDLIGLPGVGHYTAAAVRCFGFGIPEILVDTNTIRIAGRVAGVELRPEAHKNRSVREHVTNLGGRAAGIDDQDNYALLDLAGIVCTKLHPSCRSCPIKDSCQFGSSFKGS